MSDSELVYIVDHNPSDRAEIANVVRTIGLEPVAYASPEQIDRDEDRPSCVVLDFVGFGIEAMDWTKWFPNAPPTVTPTIVVSNHVDVATAVKFMQQGAMGVYEKPCRQNELYDAIGSAIRYQRMAASNNIRIQELQEIADSLNEREKETVGLVCRGFANRAIAEHLGVSLRTVESVRAKVMKKFDVESAAELVAIYTETQVLGFATERVDTPHLGPGAHFSLHHNSNRSNAPRGITDDRASGGGDAAPN